MFSKLINRLQEPSSYAGLAAILVGAGQLFKDDNLPVVADVVQQSGEAYMKTNDPYSVIGIIIAGLIAIFVPEKK